MFEQEIEQCEAELALFTSELHGLRTDDIPDEDQADEISYLETMIRDIGTQLVQLRAANEAPADGGSCEMPEPEVVADGGSCEMPDAEVAGAQSSEPGTPGAPGLGSTASAVGSAMQEMGPAPVPASGVGPGLPDDALRWGNPDNYTAREQLLSQPEFANGQVPREFGLDGLDEMAPDRLARLNEYAEMQGRGPLLVEELPSGVNPDQIDPHGPARGEFGHVASYGEHRSAIDPTRRADYVGGSRSTEIEHGIAGAQLEQVGINPATGESTYGHYTSDVTVWTERETALNKTHGNRGGPGADNPVTRRMQDATAAGQGHDLVDTAIDARANYQRAVDATGSAVSGQSVDTGVYHQMSNMSGAMTLDETADALASMPPDGTTLNMSSFDDDFMASFDSTAMSSVDDAVPTGGALRTAGRVVQVAGDVVAVAGVATSGYQVGTGFTQIADGQVGEGTVNVAEGSVNLGMEIGTAQAVSSGTVVAEGGVAAGGVTALAGLAAAGAWAWAFEDIRRAMDGRPTLTDEAVDAWSEDGLGVLTQFAHEVSTLDTSLLFADQPDESEYTNVRGLPRSDD